MRKIKRWKFNEYEILPDGETVKITLTKGKFGYCDLEDWNHLKEYTWHTASCNGTFYVQTLSNNKVLRMHVAIMLPGLEEEVNHRDFDGLNNKRNNLQNCSHPQNNYFKNKPSHNTSGYKGVSWRKDLQKWRAYICVNYKYIHLGHFNNILDAAKAYNKAAIKYFGEFAILNIIQIKEMK